MNDFVVGQRWMSEAEPELGLGVVVSVNSGRVSIHFRAGDVTRQYAAESAPIKRIRFRAGDTVKTRGDESFIVKEVREQASLLIYLGKDCEISEEELCATLSFNSPEERLLSGHFDDFDSFDLRYETLRHQFNARRSRVRGFLGGRIELLPHQLYITHEIASRHIPRVLLADEVGLGKTIEACLIMHRLLASGQITRVLIVLPSALIHQWFVELFRRFNLSFHIFDQDYCESQKTAQPEGNPFLEYQLGLCSLSFLTEHEEWQNQALSAGWDMLVVDEAHHLSWSEESSSAEYRLVEKLAQQIHGLLLLSATPEQLGMKSHFARLRLLDPNRYTSYEAFSKEKHDEYQKIADISESLLKNKKLGKEEICFLEKRIPSDSKRLQKALKDFVLKDSEARKELVNYLLDLHGVGRVMFRNTRKRMTGFPKRRQFLIPLINPNEKSDILNQLKLEFERDAEPLKGALKKYDYNEDLRTQWLADFLQEHPKEKVLLICRYKEKVLAIEKALKNKFNTKIALFHEDLNLLKRDRNAAWFAERDGAQILISSEIGSEGRNFQFTHHLVLFDLPLNQELLEQRIGRLDRIGQKEEIKIYVPYYQNSPQEILVRWYSEGLNAFEQNAVAGSFFDERFEASLKKLALKDSKSSKEIESLIKKTQSYVAAVYKRLEEGRDRLLELNSFRSHEAETLTKEIEKIDADKSLDQFMEKMFDYYGIRVELLSTRTYLLTFEGLTTEAFPGLKREGSQITYSREHALRREDIQFLSWDHPTVVGAMDLTLASETGNSSIALLSSDESRALLLEAVFVLECLAPTDLYADRFFSATPIRIVVNQELEDKTKEYFSDSIKGKLEEGKNSSIAAQIDEFRDLIKQMLEHAEELAEKQVPDFVNKYQKEMKKTLADKIERLGDLKKVNDHVSQAEVDLAHEELKALEKVIASARLRLDGLRVIWKAPMD